MQKAVIFVAATFLAQIFSGFFTHWSNIYVAQPPSVITVFGTYLNCIEIFFLLLTLSLIGIWVKDLQKSSLMHSNLKFVCYLISFHISTVSILQIIIIIDKYTGNQYLPWPLYTVITTVHGCSTMHFTLDPCLAVIERSLATLKVTNYEQFTSRKQWTILMFIKEITGIIFFYILTSNAYTAIIFAIFWIFLLVFTVITGIILYRVNLRSYKTRIGTLHLTTRYQTVENIRCLKPVLIYSFLAVIQNFITFFLILTFVIQMIAGNIIHGSMTESVINLIVSIFSVTYPLSFLGYSSRIRRCIKNKFNFKHAGSVSPKTAAAPVLSVMGKVLTSKNEQNIYFTQFNSAWK